LKKIDCAIFDLDGTLLDSMGMWRDIDIAFFARDNMELPDDYLKFVSVMSLPEAADYTIERFNMSYTPEEVLDFWNTAAQQKYDHEVPLKDGAAEYLNHLKENGVKIALATASMPHFFEPALRRLGVWELFDYAVCARLVGLTKGTPEIYLHCAEKLGVPAENCAVFEDVLEGIKGAKAAGMTAIGMFDARAENPQEIERLSDKYIHSFSEMME